ncbi:MAG: hypothetical protein ACE5EX_07585, partial [Phycisphaerae bacterium]
WAPKKPVEFVIMAGKGGGADRLARFIQGIIKKQNLSNMPFVPINKGGGSFAAQPSVDTGTNFPTSIIASDLNGDGDSDVAVAHEVVAGTVSVLAGHVTVVSLDANGNAVPDECEPPPGTARVAVNLEIDALDAAPVTRDVTLVLTECTGGTTQTRTVPVTFTGGLGSAVLDGLNSVPLPEWIGVREGHTLRRLEPLTFDVTKNAIVDLTGPSRRLVSGDLQTGMVAGDNIVDAVDFSILSSMFNEVIDAGLTTGADTTGDGVQDTADFTSLQVNSLAVGDAADGCGGGLNAQGPLAPPPNRDVQPVPVDARVDLLWASRPGTVVRGATFDIGLFGVAVRSDGKNQDVAAVDVLLRWDPQLIRLIGVVNDVDHPWLQSELMDDSGLDGLNNSLLDGDAKYTALAGPGAPATITPSGLRIAAFRFLALRAGVTAGIAIEPALGTYSATRIFGAERPNQLVTGSLQHAAVSVVAPRDCDGDNDYDLRDFRQFQGCFTGSVPTSLGAPTAAYPRQSGLCCSVFDYDGDGDVDALDHGFYVSLAGGPVR